MTWGKGEWVVVKNGDELLPGVAIELRRCLVCGGAHRSIVMRRLLPVRCVTCRRITSAIDVAPEVHPLDVDWCPCRAIREGRLFKLVIPPDSSESTQTAARPREAAGVR